MKLVAILLLGLAATASANKCGWAKPSDILQPSHLTLQKITNPDGTSGPHGDALAVSFDFNYDVYQYRVERVTADGRNTIIDFNNGYYNLQFASANADFTNDGNDIATFTAMGGTPSASSKSMLIDVFIASNDASTNATVQQKADHGILTAINADTTTYSFGHDGYDHRTNVTGEEISDQYNSKSSNIFDTDTSMVISQDATLETDVIYIVSVRSLRCGQNFYSSTYPDRGVLLKGIFRLNIKFNVIVQDQAVVGTTSMGMDNEQNVAGDLIFVKHADEVVAEFTQTLSMEKYVHDISLKGEITLAGDNGNRECAGESSGGYDDGVSTTNGKTSTATLDARENEECAITALVEAEHHDSDKGATGGGELIDGGLASEEHNGDGTFVSVDSEAVTDDMQLYRHKHNLYDSQIVTFLSLAQYVMNGLTPCNNEMLTQSNLDAGEFSPTWFQSPGANMDVSSDTYACKDTSFNRTGWTGGKCAALAGQKSGCEDVPYIIARHGSGSSKDTEKMLDITKGSGRGGCTTNAALETLLNTDATDVSLSASMYNFTCTQGYTDENDAACGTDKNGCDRHYTKLTYTPFFGFEGDEAYSPLQYARMWFGRTTDNYAILATETDASLNNPEAPEFDAVGANSTTGEQTTPDHSRRLRGVEKVRKLLKAAPPAVNEMYQQTFHFKVRAPPGKLRHRHRHH